VGAAGITNGRLIALAQNRFDVFITVDQNLEHQQNLANLSFGIVVVSLPDNNIKYFRPIFDQLLRAAQSAKPGQVVRVSSRRE
jgi:hypothetical protein